ncbi:MAG: VOC family protein [Thaumarchaeota archaeon]|nr:VOC family protein [Nitrososphaerota archaeon]
MTKPIPEGYHTVTTALTVRGAAEAIEFYKKAFGAKEITRFPGPDGKSIMHAEIQTMIRESPVMDEMPQMRCLSPQSVGGATNGIFLYVENSDDLFGKAVSAGAKPIMPVSDMFWGDRCGAVEDPFGHRWTTSTHKKDLSHQEVAKAGEEFFKSMKEKCQM